MKSIINKYFFLHLLIVIILFCPAFAEEVYTGNCGENITFQFDDEGVLTISGSGDMPQGSGINPYPWSFLRSSIKAVVIEEGITSVGGSAFYWCQSLSSVTLPDSITTIGYESFYGCSSLTNIDIPPSVTKIQSEAFYGCSSLRDISIPASLTSIGSSAFDGCTELKNVYASSLESWLQIDFRNNGVYYGGNYSSNPMWYAQNLFFAGELVTEVMIPEGTTSIGASAFRNCKSLVSITLPSSLTSIDAYAFYNCTGLTEIAVPNSITSIGNYAFSHCDNMTNCELPEGIDTISLGMFFHCKSLTEITIPLGVTLIDSTAFYMCSSLINITIPNSVNSIDGNAFDDCDALTKVYTSKNSYAEHYFEENYSSDVVVIRIDVMPVEKLEISIPEDTALGVKTSFPLQLSVYPSNSIDTKILWEVDDESLARINGNGEIYFYETGTVTITATACDLGGAQTNYKLECTNLPFEYSISGGECFITGAAEGVTELNIPTNVGIYPVRGIGSHAFDDAVGNNSIEAIALPEGIVSIGDSAFCGCDELKSIDIPDSVIYIGNYAFFRCYSLTKIDIPDRLTSIAQGAFLATGLTSITIPEGITSIGVESFAHCSNLTSISMPQSVTSIGDYAFYYCDSLIEISIPDSVTSIGSEAFNETSLKTIVWLGKTKPTLGTNVFDNRPVIYCYEFSDIDYWAFENGYQTIYLDMIDLPLSLTMPDDCALAVGKSLKITPRIFPEHVDSDIIWTSSAPEVISVDNGVLTALSSGSATIIATCGGLFDSMVVTSYAVVNSFELSESDIWMETKTKMEISIQNILPIGTTDSFDWKSTNTVTLTVDNNGILTALKPGDATIIVTSGSGVTRECFVHVCYPVTAIEFDNRNISMLTDATKQLTASVTTREQTLLNKLITFASSDKTVVTVDENGLVVAIRSGTAIITATAASGVTANCDITVRNPNTLTMPAEVRTIEREAFIGIDAEKVILPDGCERIGVQAFANNGNLFFVYMPDSVISISDDAFDGCENIRFICESENTAATYAKEHNIPYSIE